MAKYVPPHMRAQMAEDAAREEARAARGDEPKSDRYVPPGRGGGGGSRFGGGGGQDARDGGGDRQAGRFESLKEESSTQKRGSFSDRFKGDSLNENGGSGDGGSDWFTRRDGRRPNGWDQLGERAVFGERKKIDTAGINFDDYDKIPVNVSGRDSENYDVVESFRDGNLTASLVKNFERMCYDRPTPVQKHAIPLVLSGRDVMACAQTGSGKTCAFMVPCIESLLRWGPPAMPNDDKPMGSRRCPAPCALVMSPTRELTTQIFEEGRKFAYNTGIKCCVVYGGADMREQRQELNKGCDILVATPGRLKDMVDRGILTLSLLMFLILDEADRMLDMGFEPQVREIVEQMDMGKHAPRERCSMMFSATFPREVQMMARDFMRDYVFITIGRVGSASEMIDQKVVHASEREKVRELVDIIKEELSDKGLALVFVETKRGADGLERELWDNRLPVTTIHGDRSQHERERALESFRSGRTPIMIATDVASRGLDIPHVQLVVNFDIPKAIDDYVHRIGRTGRMGRKGKAITFINDRVPGPLMRDLRDLMEENDQEVPEWFEGMLRSMRFGSSRSGGKGGGKGKRKGGGHKFGGQDMRREGGGDWGGGGGGFRSGGGGGGGGGYRGGGGGSDRRSGSPGRW